MTRVCLVGADDLQLSYELLSRETAREALSAYDLREPFHNAVAVETVSLGAAVALLNDLDWYLVRFVDEAMVLEPSVSEDEWLSRGLATVIRDGEVDPAETGRLLKIYGLERPAAGGTERDTGDGQNATGDDVDPAAGTERDTGDGQDAAGDDADPADAGDAGSAQPRLVEPMYVARTGDRLPEYDLRDVEETLLVRVTEDEFERN